MQKIQLLLISDNDNCSIIIKNNLAGLVEIQREYKISEIAELEIDGISADVIFVSAASSVTTENLINKLNKIISVAGNVKIPVIFYGNGNSKIINNFLKLDSSDQTIEILDKNHIENALKQAIQYKQKQNQALEDDPHLLYDAIENLMAPLMVLNLEGEIIFVNEAQEMLHRFGKNELIGKKVDILSFNDPNLTATKDILKEVVKFGNWHGEIVEKNKSGKKIILIAKAKLLKGENGKPKAIIISANDITSKKILEEENNRFKQAIQHSHEIIFMTDKNGIINYVNSQFENFYNYHQNEVLGKNPSFLKSGYTSPEIYEQMWQSLKSGKIFNTEFINRTKDERLVTIEASISPYFDEKNRTAGYISIQRDVTEKKQNEELLRRALDKAEESDNLKTAFLNQMSHEIRTPLTSILGFMSLMEEELITRGITDLAVFFDSINRSSSRLHRTIEDILAMSSIQIGNFYTSKSKVNLYEIIDMIVKEYSTLASEKNIEFIFTQKIADPTIYADSYTIAKSFKHLIDNAVKFTDNGKIEITIYESDGATVVDVSDTGVGISKDYMNNLFKPFSQEEVGYNRRYDGNGLGLALTKEFLSLNHATISVESTKGKGSKFTISFYETSEN